MASPRPNAPTTSSAPGQTVTPPADTQTSTTTATKPPAESNTSTKPGAAATPAATNPAQVPSTSLQDSGKTRRPRDARLIHMLLASHGVTAYQERVPLQLLDFAYRYTSSTLQDAVYLATEGYMGANGEGGTSGKGPNASQELSSVGLSALRLSIASRLHYQFQPGLPKEFLLEMAAERNRVALPGVSRGGDSAGGAAAAAAAATEGVSMGGMRLPPERFCLTGSGWDLKSEWESEGEEEMEDAPGGSGGGEGVVGGEGEEEDEDEEGGGRMEDIFGEDRGEDEDKIMTDV